MALVRKSVIAMLTRGGAHPSPDRKQRRGAEELIRESALICVSILVHGVIAAPFIRLYASRAGRPRGQHAGSGATGAGE